MDTKVRPHGYSRQGEERRQAILDSLETLLRDRPLAAISVADISRASGVTRSGFYFYFPHKGAAVAAILEQVSAEMLAESFDAHLRLADPVAAVRAGLESTFRMWREHESVILAMADAPRSDPELQGLWEHWTEQFFDPLVDALGSTWGHGDDPTPRALIAVLVGANERAFERLSRSGAGPEEVRDTIAALTTLWASIIPRRQP
ncbi:TetR/AcrR family transcriptional regulator [Nocardioides insulae]|uniref:TetR/AcrR family transcriptional regulator n=1 Tax=Nocardioides insulae TaxID=394734 RepID=UPI00146D892C|nr:TetR/AcrR family transcriptional regulator [Nocardioides insulae]